MNGNYYINCQEACSALHLSAGHVYKLFREMNAELRQAGYMTVSGRIPRAYFNKKFYGGINNDKTAWPLTPWKAVRKEKAI